LVTFRKLMVKQELRTLSLPALCYLPSDPRDRDMATLGVISDVAIQAAVLLVGSWSSHVMAVGVWLRHC
jgi:hypothetical protein